MEKKKKENKKFKIKIKPEKVFEFGKIDDNCVNIVTRQLQKTSQELFEFDNKHPLSKLKLKFNKNIGEYMICYGCSKPTNRAHSVYLYSCKKCGQLFQSLRNFSRDLTGHVAIVTGVRVKLGHQIVLKLLRANAQVIGTTRQPDKALELYKLYSDYDNWKDNLIIYPESLDFDSPNLVGEIKNLVKFVETRFKKLDILINCAAQTIKCREKKNFQDNNDEKNRYGDAKYVNVSEINSWQIKVNDLEQMEMEQVYRINAVAPCLLIQNFIPLMQASNVCPFIINVHAREGLFNVNKSQFHIHTNMAKAGLAMLTKCLISCKLKTSKNKCFKIHGVDPGWISVDEYYEKTRPVLVPMLDEIDGASRIVYPIFKNLDSCGKTQRHYNQLIY